MNSRKPEVGLEAVIDRADDRQAVDHPFRPVDQRAPDQTLGGPADKHGEDQEDHHAIAADVEAQIGRWLIGPRHQRQHPPVDHPRGPPDEVKRQRNRRDHDQTGQKAVAQIAPQPRSAPVRVPVMAMCFVALIVARAVIAVAVFHGA